MDNDADGQRPALLHRHRQLRGGQGGRPSWSRRSCPTAEPWRSSSARREPINAQQRFQGVIDALAGAKDAKGPKLGKYTLYKNEMITDNAQRATCLDNAKDAIEKLSGTENVCMVGLWAYNAPAILEAAKSKGAVGKIKIVSFDEYPDTLTAIERGEIYATVVQDPYNFGYKSVEMLAEAAKSGDKAAVSKDPVRNIPHRIVAKEESKDRLGVKKFSEDLNRLLGK